MRFLTKKKRDGWMAFTATPGWVGFAHVSKSGVGKPVVSWCESRHDAVDDADIKALADALSLDKYHCALMLNPTEYQLLQIEAPNVPEAELKQAVRWRVRDLVDYPVDNATIDVLNIPVDRRVAAGRPHYLYAVVARNEVIGDKIARWITQANVPLEAIDIPEMAQRNIASYLEEAGRGLAMLSFNHGGGMLTFTVEGELCHARQIDVTLSQLDSGDEERLSHLFERVALELQRSLDSFERQFPHVAVTRLVLAPFPAREACREFLSSYLDLRVETFALADVFDFKAEAVLPDELIRHAEMMGVLGAALREETA